MTELDIAKQIAAGEISSPYATKANNYLLVAMRITGTGFAYRDNDDEYVLRTPSDYLTDDVLAMCNGLPVIIHHPEGDENDNNPKAVSDDSTIIGAIFHPYIKGSEIWGIAKVWGIEELDNALTDERTSTSSSFTTKSSIINIDGVQVTKDAKPAYCDHIAILPDGLMGVWDKLNPESNAIELNLNNEDSEMEDEVTTKTDGTEDTMSQLLDIMSQMLTEQQKTNAAIATLTTAEKAEAPAAVIEPEAKAPEAPEAEPEMKEPETKDDETDTKLAEHAERLEKLENSGYKEDGDDAEEKARILNDSMILHSSIGTREHNTGAFETAAKLRKRACRDFVAAAGTLKANTPWTIEDVDTANDSMMTKIYSQVVDVLRNIKPEATAENPLRSFIRKGQGGLADETHFVAANTANFFKSY